MIYFLVEFFKAQLFQLSANYPIFSHVFGKDSTLKLYLPAKQPFRFMRTWNFCNNTRVVQTKTAKVKKILHFYIAPYTEKANNNTTDVPTTAKYPTETIILSYKWDFILLPSFFSLSCLRYPALEDPESSINRKLTKRPIKLHYSISRHQLASIPRVQKPRAFLRVAARWRCATSCFFCAPNATH